MAEPKLRSAARAELDALGLLTDRLHAQLGAVAASDIEALAFTVMVESSAAAREDLKAIMAGVKAINAAKAGLRRRLGLGTARRKPSATALDAETAVQLAATVAVADIADDVRDLLRGRGDSMREMDEIECLRLQMAMDRVSKMMSTLSNLLKALADTQAAIVHNLK